MRNKKVLLIFASLIILDLTLLNHSAFTENEDFEERLKKGIYLFRHENYDEVLELFKEIRKSDPRSSLAAYYLGLTYKRLENYAEAKKHLEASLGMRPKIKGALIELIDILYRLDEIEEAKKWIRVAEEEGVRPAQAAFLKGLTLMKSKEYEEAIAAFQDAKSLNVELAQSANYQIGMAHLRLKRIREARDIFRDLIVLDPHTDIAAYAGQYIDAIERRMKREKPLHLTLRFAFEHDSNVLLKPSDTALVTQITDKEDTREVWDLKGDYTFKLPDSVLSLKTGYGLHISKQNDFGRYDTIGNNFSIQPNISLEKIRITFPVNYNHTIVNEKNYLSTIALGNVNNIVLGTSHMGQLGVIYKYKDYLRPSSGDEDRTGNELVGTCGFFWFFLENKGFLGIRYGYNKDWTEGENWEYSGHKATVSILLPFLEKFKFNVNGEVFLQNYDNTHTTYDKKREDLVYNASSSVSYEIIDNIELQFRYTYVNNQSNISLYEYTRQVISGGVQYKF